MKPKTLKNLRWELDLTQRVFVMRLGRISMLILICFVIGACGGTADRLKNVGKPPEMSSIQNPVEATGYQPVSIPMPEAAIETSQANSLWRSGSKAFFKDQRAQQVGDILTVNIEIDDTASLTNETTRTRDVEESAGLPNLFGLEEQLPLAFNSALNPSSLVNALRNTNNSGKGSIDREEKIELKVAAMVTQRLPNGNFVIHGRQEIRVNHELRQLQVAGIVRPSDITATNTIAFNQIAEARIAYGGEGVISDVQQPKYGQQVFDILMPF